MLRSLLKMTPVTLALTLGANAQNAPLSDDHPAITDAEQRAAIKPINPVKIILVGDSTTAVRSGWGGVFCSRHVTLFAACVNLAKGGRSSYSFRAENSWQGALAEMSVKGYADTYVLIQFGHNDQPGKPGRSSDLQTEFIPNLRQYVTEARSVGATPVLVTPLTRRIFIDGVLKDDLTAWSEAVRSIAAEMNVPLLDLNALSRASVTQMGPVGSLALAAAPASAEYIAAAKTGTSSSDPAGKMGIETADPLPPFENLAKARPAFDYTHLGSLGAEITSNLVALALAEHIPELQPYLYADIE